MDYNTKTMLIDFDYGNRAVARKFFNDILTKYDASIIKGCGVAVNNNPYNLEFKGWFSIDSDWVDKVEKFVKESEFNKSIVVNYFLGDVFESLFNNQRYYLATLDSTLVDLMIRDEKNEIFDFPCRDIMNKKNGISQVKRKKVFLSHSNLDKKVVDDIFRTLQYAEVAVWYDKYEINLGDSIVEKISKGISESDVGIILMTPNFLDNKSWANQEMKTLINRLVNNQANTLIVINKGVKHEDIPPLLQDYRYLKYEEEEDLDELIKLLKKN
jgi:hypothetical protein